MWAPATGVGEQILFRCDASDTKRSPRLLYLIADASRPFQRTCEKVHVWPTCVCVWLMCVCVWPTCNHISINQQICVRTSRNSEVLSSSDLRLTLKRIGLTHRSS